MFARRLFAAMLISPLFAIAALPVSADGPKDNDPDNVKPIPPVGIVLPTKDAEEVAKGLGELQGLIKEIGKHELLPDVDIYEKAVRWAVDYKEIFDSKGGIATVKSVLKTGLERAKAMKDGKTPWTTQTGLVVRGYRSKIDGSVQPYGLVIPKDYDFAGQKQHRLDFWWHGRGENLSEANFIQGRQTSVGDFAPPSTIVLHPYGRYCNANKFAGEIDTLECLDDVKKHYRIDEIRLVARGFSMGGAACWQFAVHYPTLWCAANPGAGFSETPEFLKAFQNEKVDPPWYEKKLWHMYNASDYALNIFDLPTVAYSGEKDSQKQAADVMAREMKKVGLELTHIIGPGAGHGWEKNAKEEVGRRVDALAEKGRDVWPKEIRFITYTTRYNRCAWVEVIGLDKHWEPGEVIGTFTDGKYDVKTKGVNAIRIQLHPESKVSCTLDGQTLIDNYQTVKEAGRIDVEKINGKWVLPKPKAKNPEHLAKVHGLQGPIDDAFMDKFIFVKPSRQAMNEKVKEWAETEMKHAADHWRKQFRGDVTIKSDKDVTDDDIKSANLILWGDPKSNFVVDKFSGFLPVQWKETGIQVGEKSYDPATHVPVYIYPNPLNSRKYLVINSGFTFREYDYLHNARQVPKLPDYAIVDITAPPGSRYPGKIVQAGFFGEKWELLPNDGK
jgi:dienelactone hydrolase